jgi:hypothetical protein
MMQLAKQLALCRCISWRNDTAAAHPQCGALTLMVFVTDHNVTQYLHISCGEGLCLDRVKGIGNVLAGVCELSPQLD